MKYSDNIIGVKKFIMSISSIVIFSAICWCFWCVFNFALVSTNLENGLFPHGPMKDFKDGSMRSLFSWVHKHTITLVFFYAPWSGQCIKLVPQILTAYKKINSSIITIAAINCWVGHCKEKFPTYHFPRLFLYHSSFSPIEYLDDFEADAIVNFLQLSITPWKYIVTSEQLQNFVENYDNYFVAYMDSEKLKNDDVYDVFYYSTLLLINPINRPHIAMVTNKTIAAMLQLREHGQIRSQSLLPMNSYSTKLNYSADAIYRWMRRQGKKVVQVLKPDLDKNLYVKQLKRGPAIILHSSLLAVENGIIQQYINVALSYHHGCKQSLEHNKMYEKSICTTFLSENNVCTQCQLCFNRNICVDWTPFHIQEMQYLTNPVSKCSSSFSTMYYYTYKYSTCCLDINGERKIKSGLITNPSIPYMIDQKIGEASILNQKMGEANILNQKMGEASILNQKMGEASILKQMSILLGYMQECYFNISKDIQNISHLTQNEKKKRLSLSIILNKFLELDNEANIKCKNSSSCHHQRRSESSLLQSMNSLIEGLGCNTNKTLNFFILNYHRYKYLLKHIGIPHDESSPLLIVDLMNEEHYILDKRISLGTMTSFILQFTLGRLEQDYLPHNHEQQQRVLRNSAINIIELTSLTFEQIVMTTHKHVFVMFYTLWCGMCKVVNLLFMKLVHSYDNDMIFSRIDADTYTLPWQYKASVYPSFILFPAYRKDHSVGFPTDMPITLENLINFLDKHIHLE